MVAGAGVGFHAAYNTSSAHETGVGNAIIGAYLTRIGLPYSAVIHITQASPKSMTWLSSADAKRLGIEVSLKSGEPIAPVKVLAVGDYSVQVSSQRSEAEALSAYSSLQQKFAGILGGLQPIIRRVDLGEHRIYYRTYVGFFKTTEKADEFCGRMKAAGGQCIVQKD